MTLRPALVRAGRFAASAAILALLSFVVDPRMIAQRIAGLEARWALAALALSVVQVVLSAWRWRVTALRLGLELPAARAVAEYYAATFLNQVLPGGVLGDVSRAWRHAREGEAARAVHAVLIERASGQLVMLSVAAISVAHLLTRTMPRPWLWPLLVLALIVVAAAGVRAGLRRAIRRPGAEPREHAFADSLDVALLEGRAMGVQLVTSLAVVGTYLATWWLAARALGLGISAAALIPLVAPVMLTMLLPVTVAGWGLREAAAAFLWNATGLTGADGVALSVAYGALVLASSLPGALVLVVSPTARGTPDRRPYRSRG